MCDNAEVTCLLINFAISGDINVIKKEAEKIFKNTKTFKQKYSAYAT
jgi:hypothetical protein